MENQSDESIGKKKKRVTANDQGQDRISDLPDSVLAHILSFLPMHDAVATGVLSRRWDCLWTNVSRLWFCGLKETASKEEMEEFVQFVHHTLSLHETNNIQEFRLELPLSENPLYKMTEDGKQVEKKLASDVDVWIHFAVRRKADSIILDVFEIPYKLPTYLLCNDSVRVLTLCHYIIIIPTNSIRWSSLKELHLCDIELSDQLIINILLGSPLLEILQLDRCFGAKNLNITSQTLTTLHLSLSPGSELTITAPYVLELVFGGEIAKYKLMNVSSVVYVKIDPKLYTIDDSYYNMISRFVRSVAHAKSLVFKSECLQVFSMSEIRKHPLPSLNCNTLIIIRSELTKWELKGIVALLRASPNLEKLVIYQESEDPYLDWKFCRKYDFDEKDYWKFRRKYDFDEKDYWSSLLRLRLKPKALNYVEIYDFTGESAEIALVEFLLKKAQNLKKMVISCKKETYTGTDTEDDSRPLKSADVMLKFSQRLMSFRKASPDALVLFS